MKAQQAASLFWLAFSILVIYGASRLEIGTLSAPGVGFMSFGAACLLLIFSVARFIGATVKGEQGAPQATLFRGKTWWRVVIVLAALLGYAYVLPLLGFLIGTFLLMLLLLRVAGVGQTWRAVLYSVCMTVAAHFVFSKCLKCQFPLGPFGF